MFVVVAAIGIACLLVRNLLVSASRQAIVVDDLQHAQMLVTYEAALDPNATGGTRLATPMERAIAWMLGQDAALSVVRVSAPRDQHPAAHSFGDADLERVAQLEQIQELELFGCQVGDEGVKHLASLRHLRRLSLAGTCVSDRGLEYVAQIRSLESLDLGGTCISSAGLANLSGLSHLRYLNLKVGSNFCGETGTGAHPGALSRVDELSLYPEFSQIASLVLSGLDITDETVREIDRLEHLESIWLDQTMITDETADVLARCEKLRLVNLADTRITDDGIARVVRARSLERLYLGGTSVTDTSMSLVATLPHLRVIDLRSRIPKQRWNGKCDVTTAGAVELAKSISLEEVSLRGNDRVTDAAVDSLSSMPNLRRIDLTGTSVDGGELSRRRHDVRVDY